MTTNEPDADTSRAHKETCQCSQVKYLQEVKYITSEDKIIQQKIFKKTNHEKK